MKLDEKITLYTVFSIPCQSDLVYLFALTSWQSVDVGDRATLRHCPALLNLFPDALTDWQIPGVQSVYQELQGGHQFSLSVVSTWVKEEVTNP